MTRPKLAEGTDIPSTRAFLFLSLSPPSPWPPVDPCTAPSRYIPLLLFLILDLQVKWKIILIRTPFFNCSLNFFVAVTFYPADRE